MSAVYAFRASPCKRPRRHRRRSFIETAEASTHTTAYLPNRPLAENARRSGLTAAFSKFISESLHRPDDSHVLIMRADPNPQVASGNFHGHSTPTFGDPCRPNFCADLFKGKGRVTSITFPETILLSGYLTDMRGQ
jgi:hypothetical protein